MCSEKYIIMVAVMIMAFSCTPYRKIRKIRENEVRMGLSISDEKPLEPEEDRDVDIDSIRGTLSEGPLIMNAIRDSETGEMVATDIISASKVTARFRNVAERAGYVSVSFDVTVPAGMADSKWQLKIWPYMAIQEDTMALEPLYITGANYRAAQLRGYQRYRAFLNSIITDTTDFIRIGQLEIFLERHYPETYAMKRDSSLISEPEAENLFGVTQRDALLHYSRSLRWHRNERRKGRVDMMYRRYVKDPIIREGIRLDTVLVGNEGDFTYRYEHTFRSRPKLRKVIISLKGGLFERGERILELPFPDDLTFYISSLSTLADGRPKYRMIVLERTVYDNTKALIDFRQGSAEVDTSLGCNAEEMIRVRRCIDDVFARDEFVLDSLVIMASCSPEGSYALNRRLSKERSEAVMRYVGEFVPEEWRDSLKASELPENWGQLSRLVANDTVIAAGQKERILKMIKGMKDPDFTERRLSGMKEYRYMREKLYPKLRSVSFDFYLHRAGMVQDTIHTTELDSVYMAGIQALKDLDYKKAVTLLRPYDDFNSALAFMSADYNHSALDVLRRLDDTDPKVCYLKAMVLSRLGQLAEAMKYFEL